MKKKPINWINININDIIKLIDGLATSEPLFSYQSIRPSTSCCHRYLFAHLFTALVYVNSCRLMRHCISSVGVLGLFFV